MIIEYTFLIKLILAHLLTDFILQPKSWIENRNRKHFASGKLYLHGLVTGIVALLFTGASYWPVAVIILVTHTLIDGWKSYQREAVGYFIIDQILHLFVIAGCWFYLFVPKQEIASMFHHMNIDSRLWILVTAVIFLTSPAGILIGQLTRRWREKMANPVSLENAGKWIGIIERMIVLIFVLVGQYAAISLLIAAKGIIRFNEKDRPEEKTEYLVIGTLMSISIALIAGEATKRLIN